MCQMFPDAACQAVQSILGDAAHSMEEDLEVKGHTAFPTLDMVCRGTLLPIVVFFRHVKTVVRH